MLPCESELMFDTSPSLYCGGTFGQDLSTSNTGSSRPWAWAAVCADASVVSHLPCAATTAISATSAA